MFSLWRRSKNDHHEPRSLYGNLIAAMQKRLEEQPSNLRLRLSLASHLEMAGRYEEAIGELQRLLNLSPGHRQAKNLLLRLKLERRLAAVHRTA